MTFQSATQDFRDAWYRFWWAVFWQLIGSRTYRASLSAMQDPETPELRAIYQEIDRDSGITDPDLLTPDSSPTTHDSMNRELSNKVKYLLNDTVKDRELQENEKVRLQLPDGTEKLFRTREGALAYWRSWCRVNQEQEKEKKEQKKFGAFQLAGISETAVTAAIPALETVIREQAKKLKETEAELEKAKNELGHEKSESKYLERRWQEEKHKQH